MSAFFQKSLPLSLFLSLSVSRRHFDERVVERLSLSHSRWTNQRASTPKTRIDDKKNGRLERQREKNNIKRKGGGGKKTNGGDGLGASLAKAAEKNAHASNVKGQRPGGNINYATRTTNTNTNTNTKTTEKGGMVSVLERDDLTEMMAMAALSNRAFEAERVRYGGPVVVSLNHANNSTRTTTEKEGEEEKDNNNNDDDDAMTNMNVMMEATTTTKAEVERAATTHAKATRIPRRPAWTTTTPVDALDRSEKEAFLEWRRALAEVEETEKVRLTPFEKNLEIWKQLWRTCELADAWRK